MTTRPISGFVDTNVQVSELSLDPQRADFSGTKILLCNVRSDNWIAVEHTLQEGRLSGTCHSERFRTSGKDCIYLFSSEFYCSFVQPALEEPKVLCKRGEFLWRWKSRTASLTSSPISSKKLEVLAVAFTALPFLLVPTPEGRCWRELGSAGPHFGYSWWKKFAINEGLHANIHYKGQFETMINDRNNSATYCW